MLIKLGLYEDMGMRKNFGVGVYYQGIREDSYLFQNTGLSAIFITILLD